LSAKLKKYEGFDPEVIKKNAEIAEKFREHEAIKNGEIEKLKNELVTTSEKKIKEWEQKYNQLNEAARQREERLNNEINNSILDSMFSGSEYVKKNVEMPVRGLRALFANRFKVDPETRKVYAVDEEGNTLLSENKIGAVASFEEALELYYETRSKKNTDASKSQKKFYADLRNSYLEGIFAILKNIEALHTA